MKKKLMMALSLVLVAALSIGGTVAYLTAKTSTATNTFTVGAVGTLNLKEGDLDATTTAQTKNYTVTPGVNITKDPKVSYSHPANPVDVYVYVTIDADTPWTFNEETNGYAVKAGSENQLSWTVASGWTYLTTTTDGKQVYYRAVAKDANLSNESVIANNTITVSGENIDSTITVGNIVFQSYAIQQAGFTDGNNNNTAADEAWAALQTELA